MNTPFKPLIWLSSLVLVILAVFLLLTVKNNIQNPPYATNTLMVSGQGKVSAVPDIAVISATILTTAGDSKVAQDQNSTKSKTVTDFLKKQGVEDKDIQTTGYNIYPQYSYPPSGAQYISGYQVSQNYEVKVRDLTKISAILSGLVSAGANQVNNLGLQIENPEKLQTEARQKAIDNAKKKAEEIEGQAGIKLGRIINFSETNTGYPPIYAYDRAASGIGGGGPVISPGVNDIVIDVSLTYQLR